MYGVSGYFSTEKGKFAAAAAAVLLPLQRKPAESFHFDPGLDPATASATKHAPWPIRHERFLFLLHVFCIVCFICSFLTG